MRAHVAVEYMLSNWKMHSLSLTQTPRFILHHIEPFIAQKCIIHISILWRKNLINIMPEKHRGTLWLHISFLRESHALRNKTQRPLKKKCLRMNLCVCAMLISFMCNFTRSYDILILLANLMAFAPFLEGTHCATATPLMEQV